MPRKITYSLIAVLTLIFFVSPIGAGVAQAQDSGWMMGLAGIFADWGGSAVIEVVLRAVGAVLEYVIVPVFSWLMTGFGGVFDAALRFSLETCNYAPPSAPVVTGSSGTCTGDGITAIQTGWILIRDFMNIGFIFIILYIAISTILRNTGAQTKRLLGGLVLAAVLVNFSMFIASLVIDAGNVLGVAFYNAIQDGSGNVGSISQAIAGGLNIQELYNPIALTGTDQIISASIRIVVFSILAAAFLMAAILFVGRIVAFIFLLTVSPVGFIGFMLPKLKKVSGQWWEMLLKQSFMAPVFLFFMYIIIVVINEADKVFANVDDVGGLTIDTYFTFAIIIGLVFAAIKYTKLLSGKIGSSMLKLGGVAAGLALGGTALVAGKVGGVAASRILQGSAANNMRQRAMKSDSKIVRGVNKFGLKTLRGAETGTFDVRNIAKTKAGKAVGLDKALGDLGKQTGISLDTGRVQKGYAQKQEDKLKKNKEFERDVLHIKETPAMKAYKETELYRLEEEKKNKVKEVEIAKARWKNAQENLKNARPEDMRAIQLEGERAEKQVRAGERELSILEQNITSRPSKERGYRQSVAKEHTLKKPFSDNEQMNEEQTHEFVKDPEKYMRLEYADMLRQQTNSLGAILNLFGQGLTAEFKGMRKDWNKLTDAQKEEAKQMQRMALGSKNSSQRLADYLEVEASKSKEEKEKDQFNSKIEEILRNVEGGKGGESKKGKDEEEEDKKDNE